MNNETKIEETPKPKIRIFVAGQWGNGDVSMVAVAEDGEAIAGHLSSNKSYGRHDMGLDGGTWKHDLYAAKYPTGYELVWVDDWNNDPFLVALNEKNRAGQTPEQALAKAVSHV